MSFLTNFKNFGRLTMIISIIILSLSYISGNFLSFNVFGIFMSVVVLYFSWVTIKLFKTNIIENYIYLVFSIIFLLSNFYLLLSYENKYDLIEERGYLYEIGNKKFVTIHNKLYHGRLDNITSDTLYVYLMHTEDIFGNESKQFYTVSNSDKVNKDSIFIVHEVNYGR